MRDLHRIRTGVHGEADASWAWPSRLGPIGRLARRGMRRLARPLTLRQRMVDDALAGALGELGGSAELDSIARDPLPAEAIVEVDSDVGPLLLHAADEVLTPLMRSAGAWDAPENRFLRSVIAPGAVVVDVGANVGYTALLAARATGPQGLVLAVEPEAANLSLLRANLWRNSIGWARVLPLAAWSRRELLPLRFNDWNRGDHQVGVPAGDGARLVPAAPLDELLGDLIVDVVKVDAQGADHEAIAGLSATLARSPAVVVMCEFWTEGLEQRDVDVRQVLAGYRDLGFTIALLDDAGAERELSDGELIAAADAAPGRYVNLVLRRPDR